MQCIMARAEPLLLQFHAQKLVIMAGTRVFCGGLDERASQQDLEAEVGNSFEPRVARLCNLECWPPPGNGRRGTHHARIGRHSLLML